MCACRKGHTARGRDAGISRCFCVAYVLLHNVDMNPRSNSEKVEKTTPYDHLRRARHGELRHHDGDGLRYLLDDYFGDADDVELIGPPTIRAA